MCILMLAGACFPRPNCVDTLGDQFETIKPEDIRARAGFFRGLWHGIIAPLSFFASLFTDRTSSTKSTTPAGGTILALLSAPAYSLEVAVVGECAGRDGTKRIEMLSRMTTGTGMSPKKTFQNQIPTPKIAHNPAYLFHAVPGLLETGTCWCCAVVILGGR